MKCKEPLAPRLLSIHNVHHYLELMRAARAAIEAGRYGPFMRETLARIDRHEHDASGRSPGRRTAVAVPPAPRPPRGPRRLRALPCRRRPRRASASRSSPPRAARRRCATPRRAR